MILLIQKSFTWDISNSSCHRRNSILIVKINISLKAVSVETAENGITVNAVCPGPREGDSK